MNMTLANIFTDNRPHTTRQEYCAARINNRQVDFVQTHSLISVVNDNHVNNNLKEILVYVYFGSIIMKTWPYNIDPLNPTFI